MKDDKKKVKPSAEEIGMEAGGEEFKKGDEENGGEPKVEVKETYRGKRRGGRK